jgi:hypothetical protein
MSPVVGLSGQEVLIQKESVSINEKVLPEIPGINWQGWDYGSFAMNKSLSMPTGHVFVL